MTGNGKCRQSEIREERGKEQKITVVRWKVKMRTSESKAMVRVAKVEVEVRNGAVINALKDTTTKRPQKAGVEVRAVAKRAVKAKVGVEVAAETKGEKERMSVKRRGIRRGTRGKKRNRIGSNTKVTPKTAHETHSWASTTAIWGQERIGRDRVRDTTAISIEMITSATITTEAQAAISKTQTN